MNACHEVLECSDLIFNAYDHKLILISIVITDTLNLQSDQNHLNFPNLSYCTQTQQSLKPLMTKIWYGSWPET